MLKTVMLLTGFGCLDGTEVVTLNIHTSFFSRTDDYLIVTLTKRFTFSWCVQNH